MATTCTFLRRYKIIDQIGEGSFSEVLKCLDTQTGTYVAAKKLKKRYETWSEASELAELVTMQKIPAHPNLLSMLGVHYDIFTGTVTFIFDLMDMSLYDYMDSRKRALTECRAKYYLQQILSGLFHLHQFGVFHRDIKPENILMKIPLEPLKKKMEHNYEHIKLGDLGSVKAINALPPYTEYISTRWYRSPECLLTKGFYESKMDIWAVGCVFYEMLTTKPLFAGINEVDQLKKIHQVLGSPSHSLLARLKPFKSCNWNKITKQVGTGINPLLPNLSTEGVSLMKMMITYDPELRGTVKQLLAHKYFQSNTNTSTKDVHTKVTGKTFNANEKIPMKSLKALTTINLRKSQQKRAANNRPNDNVFSSVTENNIIHYLRHHPQKRPNPPRESSNLKQEQQSHEFKITPKNVSQSEPKNICLKKMKHINHAFDNYKEILKALECKANKAGFTKEKEIKSRFPDEIKLEHGKHNEFQSSTESNLLKRSKQFNEFRKDAKKTIEVNKKTIEASKHTYDTFNEILKKADYRRQMPNNQNKTMKDSKETKKVSFANDKLLELRKEKKRVNPIDSKRVPDSSFRRTYADLQDFYKKTTISKDTKKVNNSNNNTQSKSFVSTRHHHHHHKNVEPS